MVRMVAQSNVGVGRDASCRCCASDAAPHGRFSGVCSQEELVLNAVSAVTNVTFYMGGEQSGGAVLLCEPRRLVRVLLAVMNQPNEEGVVEACRALGNLSRREEALFLLLRSISVPRIIPILL